MNKILVSAAAALALFAAAPAFAQTYYPSTVCTAIAPTLSLGQSGSQVLSLQEFLVSQNYPGSGTWMETGYFGAATQAAVIDFQQLHGLPQTGLVDSATASAITSASCGSTSYPYLYQTTSPYTYNQYPYNYTYSYTSTPVITSLSQNTGYPGQSVTISGAGFDPSGNTVTIGGTVISGISSPTGTTLTFTIPYTSEYAYSSGYSGTPVQLTVSDSRGTSNSVSFTVYGSTNNQYPYTCGAYPYYTSTTYAYCPPTTNTTAPTISYLSPQSGGVGTSVTIYGSGFSTSGNTIHFGSAIIVGEGSSDGDSVSFVIPSTLVGYGSQPITLSTYQVSVTNSFGYTSNAQPFTVTSTNATGAPTITSVSGPTSLAVGQQGTWTVYVGSGANQYLTFSASWGDQNVYPYSSQQAQTVYQSDSLTHTYSAAGTYTIQFTVSNSYGQSNTYSTTVQVGQNGNQGSVYLSYLSPSSGSVGTTVTIYGSGLTGYNTIMFGSGAIQNVYSQSGTSLTFTVPSSVAPYCAAGSACPQYVQAITPGTYPVSVQNQNGTSNSLSFTVLQ